MRGRLIGWLAGAAALPLLAGCDLTATTTVTATASAGGVRATCIVSAIGRDAAITFTGPTAGSWCQQIITIGRGGWDFGVVRAAAVMCQGATNDGTTFTVTDSGSGALGQTMCRTVQQLIFGEPSTQSPSPSATASPSTGASRSTSASATSTAT